MKRLIPVVLILAAMLMLVACGGSGGEQAAVTVPPVATEAVAAVEPTAPPTDTPVEVAPTAETAGIASFRDALQATVQIEGQGSFVDPEFGLQLNSAGRGSGFIIDPTGIAVTNNHVVTGAAFLQVWVPGEDQPRNARVLGVSECSDLAVIDIDGDDFSYLVWATGRPQIGTDIYALGYPLGDPEPTITRGIISKERAGGETSWASVDAVIEHDATINPGNSGGPLVNELGQVVGVNYAGDSSANQYFAINAADAQAVINLMRAGSDVNAIGVNGEAVSDGQGLTGIWVASVESGSPADAAGIKSGDIITKMEGLVLATDGTMADYCDILRSNTADDVMSVEVLRFDTQEVLEGQLNGRALEPSFSFAVAAEDEVADNPGNDVGGQTVNDFVAISDDSGAIVVEVPASWVEIDGSPWLDQGTVIGGQLLAAPSIDGYSNTYDTPGIQILASYDLAGSTMDELLDFFDFSDDCTVGSRSDYEDPVFTGRFDIYTDCAGQGTVIAVVAAEPADQSFAVIIIGQAITDADLEALDHVLDTFNLVGPLPQ
jgi:serine protease Do